MCDYGVYDRNIGDMPSQYGDHILETHPDCESCESYGYCVECPYVDAIYKRGNKGRQNMNEEQIKINETWVAKDEADSPFPETQNRVYIRAIKDGWIKYQFLNKDGIFQLYGSQFSLEISKFLRIYTKVREENNEAEG